MILYFQKVPLIKIRRRNKSTLNEHPKKRLSSYAVKSKKDQKDEQQRKERCLICEKSPKERTKILAKGKLCFRWFKPMTENHNAKSCRQRLVCRLCFELHPTGMHGYMKKKTNEDHNNA